jgi:hypothetical protein
MSDRRNFLKRALIGSAGLAAIPAFLSANEDEMASTSPKISANYLKNSNVILFQGDSITDAGRKRDNQDPNNQSALGGGYALLAAADLLNIFATKNLKIYNKGISGNKVYQLAERWQTDCLDLKLIVTSTMEITTERWQFMRKISERCSPGPKRLYPR